MLTTSSTGLAWNLALFRSLNAGATTPHWLVALAVAIAQWLIWLIPLCLALAPVGKTVV